MGKIIILIKNIKGILKKNFEDNIPAISAQSAFFIILSFVPFLIFALAIIAKFGVSQSEVSGLLKGVFIDDAVTDKLNSILAESYSAATGVAVTTVILALWSAGKGVYSITEGIRVIYRLPNKYNWFVKRLFSMGYTILMFLAIGLTVVGLLVSEFADSLIKSAVKNLPFIINMLYTLRYFIILVVVTLLIAFALMMYLRPRVEDKRFAAFKVQLPGAILTSLGWVVLSLGIKIYVNYFNGFSIYGSLGTLAIVMVWMYFSIYIFAFGIQINYMYCVKIYETEVKKLFKRKS